MQIIGLPLVGLHWICYFAQKRILQGIDALLGLAFANSHEDPLDFRLRNEYMAIFTFLYMEL